MHHRAVRLAVVLGAVAGLSLLGVAAPSTQATTRSDANLLTGDTALLRHGVGAWAPVNSRISIAKSGVLAIRSSSSQRSAGAATAGRGITRATAYRVYRARALVHAASKSRQVMTAMTFYDSSRKLLTTLKGQPAADTRASWVWTPVVVGLAPPRAAYVVVHVLVAGAPTGEVHYMTRPVLGVATQPPQSVVGPLRTRGNTIYDARGPVQLHGIHRTGLEFENEHPITVDEMRQARSWGATLVRLSVSSAYWDILNCSYQLGYVEKVDQAVRAITSQGMVAMIDLHTSTTTPCGMVTLQPMADYRALDFWKQVANRYKDNPLVAFDLYNEPHWISDDVWLHGGWVKDNDGRPFLAAGMQQLYGAVRSTGATNLVVVSGNDWGIRMPAGRVSGTNIAYGMHVYTCPQSTSRCYGSDPTPALRRWVNPGKTVPVVVAEFGWPSTSDGRYLAKVIGFAAQQRWSWAAFAWDGRTTGTFSLLAETGPVYQPTASGMPVLSAMRFR